MSANRIAPDGTPRFAASYLGLFCLPMPHKKDTSLIWVKVPTRYMTLHQPASFFVCLKKLASGSKCLIKQIEILLISYIGSKTTKALIRLRGGRPLLFAYRRRDKVHI